MKDNGCTPNPMSVEFAIKILIKTKRMLIKMNHLVLSPEWAETQNDLEAEAFGLAIKALQEKLSSVTEEPQNLKKTSTFRERLKEAMNLRKMTQADLAKATGLSKGGISNYVLGRYEPKSEIINKLAIALKCSEKWLQGYEIRKETQNE